MKRKKILIVDDAETILMMEKIILSRENYDLVLARDGIEAFQKAKDEKPDLILLDIIMPNMNGFETCRAIKGNELTGTIPIIMVTTRGEDENIEKGFACGCDDYVTKPIQPQVLVSKIKQYLP